ncbi:MAG: hypothetical protein ACRD0N_13685, partial [Acidimicrobiales bacterium]
MALANRLTARAFALAVEPTVSPEAAGEVLAEMAADDGVALRSARRRVEARLFDRPTRLAE